MIEHNLFHKINTFMIDIYLKATSTTAKELIIYEDKDYFTSNCEKGCPNYNNNWSCPPHSPIYTQYSQPYKYAVLFLLSCKNNQFDYIKSEYLKVEESNSVLTFKMDELCRFLEAELDGKMLSNGWCQLCETCSCKMGFSCIKPAEMRYSLQSLGLNVAQLATDYFNHDLLWFDNEKAPEYSTVIACILTNFYIEDSTLVNNIKKLQNI